MPVPCWQVGSCPAAGWQNPSDVAPPPPTPQPAPAAPLAPFQHPSPSPPIPADAAARAAAAAEYTATASMKDPRNVELAAALAQLAGATNDPLQVGCQAKGPAGRPPLQPEQACLLRLPRRTWQPAWASRQLPSSHCCCLPPQIPQAHIAANMAERAAAEQPQDEDLMHLMVEPLQVGAQLRGSCRAAAGPPPEPSSCRLPARACPHAPRFPRSFPTCRPRRLPPWALGPGLAAGV